MSVTADKNELLEKEAIQLMRECENEETKNFERLKRTLDKARRAGEKFIQIRDRKPHGTWEKWCKQKKTTPQNVNRYIRIARDWDKLMKLTESEYVSIRQADRMLAKKKKEKNDYNFDIAKRAKRSRQSMSTNFSEYLASIPDEEIVLLQELAKHDTMFDIYYLMHDKLDSLFVRALDSFRHLPIDKLIEIRKSTRKFPIKDACDKINELHGCLLTDIQMRILDLLIKNPELQEFMPNSEEVEQCS